VADDRGDDGDDEELSEHVGPAFREVVLTYAAMHDLGVQMWK
jgi:hypothetical protein